MQYFEPLIPGYQYHIYNRGINGEDIFKEHKNYTYFLKLYQQHVTPYVETIAFNLLINHFHLMVTIKEKVWVNDQWIDNTDAKTSKAFSNLFNAYAQGINKVYHRTGGLFQTPFKRKILIDKGHFTWLPYYIHTNSQLHGLVADFRLWPPCSYNAYLKSETGLVNTKPLLDWFGGKEAFIKYHEQINLETDLEMILE
jgi:putative transposase